MRITVAILISFLLTCPVFADFQVDSFDDISGYSIYAPSGGGAHQGASPVDPVDEGTGSMVLNYAPGGTADAIYLAKYISPIDLSAQAAAGASMSIRMWVAADTVTTRLINMQFETSYQKHFLYTWPLNATYDVGWNTVTVSLAAFTAIGSADWSNITRLAMQTGMYPTPPAEAVGDLVLDDWRIFVPPPLPPPGVIGQIDNFEDISEWSVSPPGVIIQGTAPNDPVKEGAGSLIADYTPYSSDNYTFSKVVAPALNLEQAANIGAIIHLSMWIGKTSQTARIDYLSLESSAGNEYRYDIDAGGSTYPIGWNQLIMPMSDFTVIGSPDWSNITKIVFGTTCNGDTTPADVVFDNLHYVEATSLPAGQIETFDDIRCMNVYPDKGWAVQDELEYAEGTGALRLGYADNYAGDPTDDFQISWYTAPLDLSPSTIGTSEASISLWIWSGKESATSRPYSITFATEYDTDEYTYVVQPSQATYDTGWNQLIMPMSDFTVTGSPDWSNITWIAVNTTCTPDTAPTDLIIDNLRLVGNKCNIMDVDGDCEFTLSDLALTFGCWLVGCIADPGNSCCALVSPAPVINQLRCEYQDTPLGIDNTQPRFSWKISSTDRGVLQSGYQILVASSQANLDAGYGDMWDSGKVYADQSTHIPYAGQVLVSGGRYYWKARSWDQTGKASAYSEPTWFSMGLLDSADWGGNWIGGDPGVSNGTRKIENGDNLVRKEITINKSVERAQVFISGLGYYELRINGAKVGDHVLDPGWTEFHHRALYVTYDVTELLQTGTNAIGVMLGNGFYSFYAYFYAPRVILQMNIDFTDGTSISVVSDGSWKTTTGPILTDEIYNGETYDARLEKTGWDSTGYNDSAWSAAQALPSPSSKLTSQMIEPIKVIETMAYERTFNGNVYDMGQNFAGWTRLTVQGDAGDTVVLRHAEDINGDGTIDPTTNGTAENTDTYILKGGGVEVYEPRFTYHGFRFVEVTTTGSPTIVNIEGRVVHNSVETVGEFLCSNTLINRIHQNILWGMRSNLYGVLTDCPQRAERAGWLEVGHNLQESLTFNFSMARFYSKWMNDLKDDQEDTRFPVGSFANGTTATQVPYIGWASWPGDLGWTSFPVIAPWHMYEHYGDKQILAEYYAGSKRFVDIIEEQAVNYLIIDSYNNFPNFALFSDWGDPDTPSNYPTDADKVLYRELHGTAFFYYCTSLVATKAAILGNSTDAAYYSALADNIKNAFNSKFFNYGTNQYVTGSQYCNTMPLYLGIVPAGREAAVAQNIADNLSANGGHLSIGEVGLKYMTEVLMDYGHAEAIYTMVTKTSHPSWGHDLNLQVVADGVTLDRFTTLVEFWGGGGSHNHIMWGTIDEWYYKALAGIDVNQDEPGYKLITIKPNVVGDLTWAQASVDTIRGTVISDWNKSGNTLTLNVTLPGNSTAKVHVPKIGLSNVTVTENGMTIWQNSSFIAGVAGITAGTEDNNYVIFDVGSGAYIFVLNGI